MELRPKSQFKLFCRNDETDLVYAARSIRGWTIKMIQGRQVKGQFMDSASVKPGEGTDRLFQLTMLHALLLPPKSRDVFVLTEMHGYTLPEVAKVLGISKDDVKKHLRRARRGMHSI
jgi:RNA polymerase sigma factor (sigma-70 family)